MNFYLVPGGPSLPGYLFPLEKILQAKEILLRDAAASSAPPPYNIDSLVEDIAQALTPSVKPILLGHSAGAMLALAYGAQSSDKLAGLILLNPGPLTKLSHDAFVAEVHRRNRQINPEYDSQLDERASRYRSSSIEEKGARFLALLDLYWPAYFVDSTRPADLRFEQPKGEAIESLQTDFVERTHDGTFLKAAERIQCPVLMIHSDLDPIPYAETVELLKTRISKFEFNLIIGAGHFLWYEKPDVLMEMISRWRETL